MLVYHAMHLDAANIDGQATLPFRGGGGGGGGGGVSHCPSYFSIL